MCQEELFENFILIVLLQLRRQQKKPPYWQLIVIVIRNNLYSNIPTNGLISYEIFHVVKPLHFHPTMLK